MSPPQKEWRPEAATSERHSEDSAAAKPLELFDVDSRADRAPVATQLRRRRVAALRCEPLDDGQRDPWSVVGRGTPTAKTSRTLHVEVGRRTAWLYGRDGRDVFALLDEVGLERRQWDWERKAWMVPLASADDVMSYAEWRQRRTVTCEAVDR